MIAFDALVGANDRHAQNWGVVASAVKAAPVRFAPIFDTARGLFWNHSDELLARRDVEGRRDHHVEAYAKGSVPLIGFEKAEQRPNHFDLIEHVVSQQAALRAPILDVVMGFRPEGIARLLHREFRRLLSRRRLEYIDALLRYRHSRLRRACGLT